MKQTQNLTHAWSLAGKEAVAYSLARGKAAEIARESGEVAACSLARERKRPDGSHLQRNVAKQKQPLSAGLDTMRGARAQKIT